MPDLVIKQWPLAKLLRYANNSRDHSEAQVEQIATSIKEFGFVNPCLVDAKGVLIAGHGRVSGAQKAGLESVPVVQLGHLSETQARALRIADNAIALNATWNIPILKMELEALRVENYSLALTGFDDVQLVQFMANVSTNDPEATPEPPATPVTRKGDLWVLGDHRILCGDSTNDKHVERLLDGDCPVLMATDPPYLVDYTGGNHPQSFFNNPDVKDKHWDSYKEGVSGDLLGNFIKVAFSHLAKRAPIYMWHASLRADLVFEAFRKNDLLLHQVIIWKKSRAVLTRHHFMWDFEPAAYGWLKGDQPDPSRRPPNNVSTVWEIDQKGEQDGIHPTQKPVEIFKRPLEYHTRATEICYEPFSGSGTQIIAAEMTSRRCRAMELEPSFVDVAVVRWQDFATGEAILESTGQTFAEVKAEREAKPKRRRRAVG